MPSPASTQRQASAADLARIARGQWGIESVHWLRDTAYAEDANTGYAGSGPQVMATRTGARVSAVQGACRGFPWHGLAS